MSIEIAGQIEEDFQELKDRLQVIVAILEPAKCTVKLLLFVESGIACRVTYIGYHQVI